MKKDFKIDINDKCGVSYHNISEPFPMFYTSDMFVIVIESGKGKIIINDKEFLYKENSVFAASFTDYFLINPEEQTGLYKFEFSFSLLKTDVGRVISIDLFPDEIKVSEEDALTVKRLCDMIVSEIEEECQKPSVLFINSVVEQVIICTLSNMINRKKSDERIMTALVYMYENFRANIIKEEVADASGISRQIFGSFFYESTGVRFKECLKNIRLNYCMKLIKCTNMNFTDICFESGFNSSQYFSSSFKGRFGVSPKGVKRDNIIIF